MAEARTVTCLFSAKPHPMDDECQTVTDVLSEEEKAILAKTYWKIRDHALEYRNTRAFKLCYDNWRDNRDDPKAYQKFLVHEFFARGLEKAAHDLAEMLGVPEYEIERGTDNVDHNSKAGLQAGAASEGE